MEDTIQSTQQEGSSEHQALFIKIATYNLLNTKDRYNERERLLKQNLYELNADVIGLQEVVFGSKQLDELAKPLSNVEQSSSEDIRHHINLEEVGASTRSSGYAVITAPVQLPIFHYLRNPDSNAFLDGNAFLIDYLYTEKLGKLMKQDVLHISAFRNCHRVEIKLWNGRTLHVINMHLHHPMDEGFIRLHQIQNVLFWIETFATVDDAVVMIGDYNAEPDSETYNQIVEHGFISSYKAVNGKEPEKTFPTGLQAPFMDTDPTATLDFIFYKGRGIKPVTSKRMGHRPDPKDPTIYGSDHFPIVTEFEITNLH